LKGRQRRHALLGQLQPWRASVVRIAFIRRQPALDEAIGYSLYALTALPEPSRKLGDRAAAT
jgi:hypothetical protein